MDKVMLKNQERTEFEKWWNGWISRRTQNRVLVTPRPFREKSDIDVECPTDQWPGNLAHRPDIFPDATPQP
jgi:hypothetical protein